MGGSIGLLKESGILDEFSRPGGYMPLWDVNTSSSSIVDYNSKELTEKYSLLWKKVVRLAMEEEPVIRLVALPEPLKVRVIGKGPGLTYMSVRPIWKKMYDTISAHPAFIINRSISEKEMLDRLGKLKDGEKFLSGDYADATNRLRSLVSNTIAYRIALNMKLTEDETTLFIRALTKHKVEDPEDSTSLKVQENGQSMGSIVSFPILCIANATVTAWALELTSLCPKLLKDLPMLINGDDIAARGKEELYMLWKKIATRAGLEESLGKTYFSNKFVQMNSTNFTYNADNNHFLYQIGKDQNGHSVMKERACPYTLVRYINTGLIQGLKRSSGDRSKENDEGTKVSNIGVRAREVVRMAPEHLQETVLTLFIQKHQDILKTMRVNWFLPEWIGGIGFPNIGENKITDLDLRKAAYILKNWDERKPKSLVSTRAGWQTWKIAQKRSPKPMSIENENSKLVAGYDRLMKYQTMNTLFDSDITVSDLLKEEGRSEEFKRLQWNTKLWKISGEELNSVRPLKLEDLNFEKKFDALAVVDLAEPNLRIPEVQRKDLAKELRENKRELLKGAGGIKMYNFSFMKLIENQSHEVDEITMSPQDQEDELKLSIPDEDFIPEQVSIPMISLGKPTITVKPRILNIKPARELPSIKGQRLTLPKGETKSERYFSERYDSIWKD